MLTRINKMVNENLEISVADYQKTLSKIQSQIAKSKDDIQKIVSRHKIEMAWNIGKIIGEYFLTHDENTYGKSLIKNLSRDVGIDAFNLYKMRSFYKNYPSLPKNQEQFSWTHYRILIGIKEEEKRNYFEHLIKEHSLNSRELQSEVNNAKPQIIKNAELTPRRGFLFHYEIIQIPKKPHSYFLDLGFGVLKESTSELAKKLQIQGKIVTSMKKNESFEYAQSSTPKSDLHTYVALLDRVVDGDTVRVNLDLGFGIFEKQILRLAKINAPELKTLQGKKSAKELEKILLPYDYLIIKTLATDIFGRYVAEIFLPQSPNATKIETAREGIYLNQKILDLGLAKPY